QDRTHGDLLAADAREATNLERGLNLDVLRRQVLRRLVRQQQRDLVHQLAEVDRRRVPVAQVRQLVLDERVLDLDDDAGAGLGHRHWASRACGTLPRGKLPPTYVVQPRKPG